MKVYNKEKTQVLEEYDLTKGHLLEDYIDLPEVQEVKEQGHYETIKEYPNGGKDVKWVVDIKGVEYQPAKREKILVYTLYTSKELKDIANQKRISELKQLLSSTDYQAIKYAEGELTDSEYTPIKQQRKAWREEINELEEQLGA